MQIDPHSIKREHIQNTKGNGGTMEKAELTYQIGEVLSYAKWSHEQSAMVTRYYFIADYLEDSREYIIDGFGSIPLCVCYKAQELDSYFKRVKE